MTFTVYPNAIDDSESLIIATDNVTPVQAEIVNRLREAIVAVESELGIQPSGTYSTVRARLDSLDSQLTIIEDIGSDVLSLGVVLVLGNTTNSTNIVVSTGSSVVNESGTTSLSDFLYSPALILTEQASIPTSVVPDKGIIWLRNDNVLLYTDDLGIDHNLITELSTTSIKTSVYTAAFGDLVRCDPTSGGFTVNLPTAIGNINKSIIVKNISNSINSITIDPFGSQLIDGSSTYVINIAYQSITLVSDNSNWMVI